MAADRNMVLVHTIHREVHIFWDKLLISLLLEYSTSGGHRE